MTTYQNPVLGDFEIAPRFKASRWKQIDIQKSTRWSREWRRAVGVFERRINARFIKQVEAMINNPNKAVARFSGFAIVALDCLLVETLDQFYKGRDTTPDGQHVAAFHAVFQRSQTLSLIFTDEGKTGVFYGEIRCGLLHQAQTKGKSKISRKRKTVIEWCDKANPREGLVVHPRLFHKCVEEAYSDYLKQLRSPANGNLRDKFRKKMNRIAGMN